METANIFMVGSRANNIVIMRYEYVRELTREDALLLAAWLVACADFDDTFEKVLEAVKAT